MRRNSYFILPLVFLIILSFCACGQSSVRDSVSMKASEVSYEAPYAYDTMAAQSSNSYTSGAGFGMVALASPSLSESAQSSDPDLPLENPEKIIYSGEATIETTAFDKTIADLENMVSRENGFIESSSLNGNNYYNTSRGYTSHRRADYTIRIPSERFSSLMAGLSDFGNVPYTYTWTENVTAEYYDVQARLEALLAQESRLVEMMKIAETVEDVITIEDKLTDVRYRIDSLQSSLNNWDRRVSFSTLNITVNEVQTYTPEKVTSLTFGEELARTFTDALSNTGEFFKSLLLFLVSAFPAIIILLLLFFILRPLFRKLCTKLRNYHLNRKASRAARKTPGEKKPE